MEPDQRDGRKILWSKDSTKAVVFSLKGHSLSWSSVSPLLHLPVKVADVTCRAVLCNKPSCDDGNVLYLHRPV